LKNLEKSQMAAESVEDVQNLFRYGFFPAVALNYISQQPKIYNPFTEFATDYKERAAAHEVAKQVNTF